MKYIALIFSVMLTATPAFAGCVDLKKGNTFTMTRVDPFFRITNTVSSDGTVLEVSERKRNGPIRKVTTTYWNGVIAVDRKSS
jgi:hypothetical protein